MTEPTVQEKLMARAVKDPVFRQDILDNPRAVLASEYNVHLPEHITVRIFEEMSNTLSIILPPQEEAVRELSDEDLEAVAGGAKDWVIIAWTFICYTEEDV